MEYTKGEEDVDYLKLTSILHIKDDTPTIYVLDLKAIFENVFTTVDFTNENLGKSVVDLIFEESEYCLHAPEGVNLEYKIVLSIGIRLKAEEYMLREVSDKTPLGKSQTFKLLKRFKMEFSVQKGDEIKLLEEVCIITPENIHLNSLVYEPIWIWPINILDICIRKFQVYNHACTLHKLGL